MSQLSSIPPPPPPPPSLSPYHGRNEHDVIEEYIKTFMAGCRILPSPQVTAGDSNACSDNYGNSNSNLQELYDSKSWQQILLYINASPLSDTLNVYFKELLDYSSIHPTFGYHIESLFYTRNYDDILHIVSQMLDTVDAAYPPSQSNIQKDSHEDGNRHMQSTNNQNKTNNQFECSIVLKFLALEVNALTGRGLESIQNIHKLEEELLTLLSQSQTLSPTTSTQQIYQQWYYMTLLMKINLYIRQRHHDIAIKELVKLIKMCNKPLPSVNPLSKTTLVDNKTCGVETQIVLFCHLSILCIQTGAVKASEQYYNHAYTLFDSSPSLRLKVESTEVIMSADSVCTADEIYNLLLLTHGLVYFALSQYEEAMSTFNTMIERYKQQHLLFSEDLDSNTNKSISSRYKNTTSKKSSEKNHSLFLFYSLTNISSALLPLAVNNMTICALFLKQMEVATLNLENLIKLNPFEYCKNYIIFNLCTLYDLSLTPEQSNVKKKSLYKITLFYDISESIVPFQAFRLN